MKEKMILDKSNIANAIFRNLSADEIRGVKGVSHIFYERATEYLIGNLKNENFHLSRVVPPSDAIQREQKVEFCAKSLQALICSISKGEEGKSEKLHKFNNMMEKIRRAVQSNLGLSRVQRETYETFHPIYVKLGAPVFPINDGGQLDPGSIVYRTAPVKGSDERKSSWVILLKDDSKEDGLSICFDTKFRKYLLHIDGSGHVTSQLTLRWTAIYDDLLPDKAAQQPLRAFTPWQRHAEANFFNGRSTNKILGLLTKNYPEIFNYDPTSYFKEEPVFSVELNRNAPQKLSTDKKNIYLTLDESFFKKPDGFEAGLNRQPILAVIKTSSPLRGDCFSVVPAIYEKQQLHILIKGHQQHTQVVDVFHANFKTAELQSWELLDDVSIFGKSSREYKPELIDLNLLSNQQSELMSHVSTAPMVRGSGPGARQYWLNGFFKSTVYSEMIVIAEIFNSRFMSTPLASLEQTLHHSDATKSFYRLQFSRQELEKAKEFVFQLAIPNEFSKQEDFDFFYGENGNKLEEITKLAILMLKRMVPKEFHHKIRIGINMCCPAASVENIGSGFGLRNKPDFIERIVKAIKDTDSNLKVEFKTLMLSHEDSYGDGNQTSGSTKNISEVQNERLTRIVSKTKADRLVYQGKPRNIEAYNGDAVSSIIREAKTPKEFQFGYSGMVAAITNHDIHQLGYKVVGEPHYSVQSILEKIKKQLGEVPIEFEVMLGRVLLGSAWVLQGRYASDAEILLHTLLQAAIEQEWAEGMGRYGVDIYQIQILYNIRHITNDNYRNYLINKILNAQSTEEIIDKVFEQYLSIKKKGECNILQLHRLEEAVFAAIPDNKVLQQYKLITEPKSKLRTGLQFFSNQDDKQTFEEKSVFVP
ncbi:TPA: hypothetical protein RG395_000400 [Legionella pneumophila]|nr:lpg1449 family Dot/Icm T4SS effector [Legionella pneumophila]HAT1845029.1 hypothetical protein [Legionella pneumophila]HAT1860422.1 hypothetical protein [Legionella pneumophila]HAT3974556.1 hypothetical protein [Legionella pneumophila]HAT6936403.1 hypothetical protein [Legionella pneumophila]HAT8355426.1 hypothetical protein [Legionella pneumophila]